MDLFHRSLGWSVFSVFEVLFWRGGVQKAATGLQFLSLGCGKGSK